MPGGTEAFAYDTGAAANWPPVEPTDPYSLLVPSGVAVEADLESLLRMDLLPDFDITFDMVLGRLRDKGADDTVSLSCSEVLAQLEEEQHPEAPASRPNNGPALGKRKRSAAIKRKEAGAVIDFSRAASRKSPGSSVYRGVSRHRMTGRFEASIWHDKRQIYLGNFASEVLAARAHDIAALALKGPGAHTNLQRESYSPDLDLLGSCSVESLLAYLRRDSPKEPARGKSKLGGRAQQE